MDTLAVSAPPLIVVTGPTGAGKSAAGLDLAVALGGEIVSCDSLQVYRGFDIGSAKPSPLEQARVPHHLLDVVEADQEFSAAAWLRLAEDAIVGIRARGKTPIVVGGTGLYLKALLHGLFDGPSRDDALRTRLTELASRRGDGHLHALLRRLDRSASERIDPRDRVRMVRALEVRFLTGRPISLQQTQWEPSRQSARCQAAVVLGLDPGREVLRASIEERCDSMLAAGLLDEVRRLVTRWGPSVRPLQAIGYRQMIGLLEGRLEYGEARRRVIVETRRFAKRQRTWFRRQTPPDEWFTSGATLVASAHRLLAMP